MVGDFGTSSFNKLLFVCILGENVKMHTSWQHRKELWKNNQLFFLCIDHFVSICTLFPRWGMTKKFSICDSCVLLVTLYPLVFYFQGGARWRFLSFVVIVTRIYSSLFSVTTSLWSKCEDEIHTPKSENLEFLGTLSELDCRGQNTLHWGVLYTVGKVLKCRCPKWPCMSHLDICNTSYGRKKGGRQIGSLTLDH
jgi:hypothetical protein